jgi:endonuclease YncB( thermonuclease family)
MKRLLSQVILITGYMIFAALAVVAESPAPSSNLDERLSNNEGVYVKIERVSDFDDIVVLFENCQITVQLANVAPLSQWSEVGDEESKKVRKQALQFAKKTLTGEEVLMKVEHEHENKNQERPAVYLSWTAKHRAKRKWHGKTPSQRIGWGMTSVNILLVEKGYSVYVSNDFAPPQRIITLFKTAEDLAKEVSVGIWGVKNLVNQIRMN